ncbi:MAG: hypothetical protein Ta2G_04070 [Termitinemataceae bacterium]|nr:MAG: hypothetical protein Ta2G_04070 [Termitinemataceae bacterium]
MKLSGLIKPELVLLKQPFNVHNKLLENLIDELYRGNQKISLSRDVVYSTVMARETLQGVLLSTGLSIPHVRLNGLHESVIVIGVPEEPIPTRGPTPVRMMILMLTPPSDSTEHLNVLAAFGKLSQSPLFSLLCEAADSATFIKLLDEAGIEVSKNLSVATIMNTAIKALNPNNTLREVMDMFRLDRLGYVPILDDNDNFVGELTMNDLLAISIPTYALKMSNLKFLTDFEPLNDLLRNENNIRVGDVMKKPSITLDAESPVVEAVLKFVQSGKRYIPVVKNGNHIVGVVGCMDVLKKVLRA